MLPWVGTLHVGIGIIMKRTGEKALYLIGKSHQRYAGQKAIYSINEDT